MKQDFGSAPPLCLDRSRELWKRAQGVLFQGTSTYSKSPRLQPFGAAPIFVERAAGAWMWDVDGNGYLDLGAGVGSVLLGHADAAVNRAVEVALAAGHQVSLASPLEVRLAERLRDLVAYAERVRFVKTGAEAVAAGVRVARAVTGRSLVIRGPYHGWHDWAMAGTSRNAGIPRELHRQVRVVTEHDPAAYATAVRDARGDLALICVDPIGELESPGEFLAALRRLADEAGALLLFDEIATGLRFGLEGAGARFGVHPDLATFGKALANGYPLAALVGRAEVFDAAGEVFITSTFAGESTALAAALAVLEELQGSRFLERLEHCGRRLRHCIDRWGAELGQAYSLHTVGHACRFKVQVEGPDAVSSRLARSVIHQEMARRSVLLARVCYPCLAWTDADLDLFAAAVRESTQVLQRAIAVDGLESALDGEPIGDIPIL